MPVSELIHLTGGIVVPREPWDLVLHLERIGVKLTVDGADIEVEGTVNAETLAELRRWKPHVIMLLQYVADDSHLRDRPTPRQDTDHDHQPRRPRARHCRVARADLLVAGAERGTEMRPTVLPGACSCRAPGG